MNKKYKYMSSVTHIFTNLEGKAVIETISKADLKKLPHIKPKRTKPKKYALLKCRGCNVNDDKFCAPCLTLEEKLPPETIKNKNECLSTEVPFSDIPDYKEFIHAKSQDLAMLKKYISLPMKYKAVILLKLGGFSQKDIVQSLSIPRRTVQYILNSTLNPK